MRRLTKPVDKTPGWLTIPPMINEGKKRDASPHAHLGLPGMARRLPQSSDGGVEGHAAPKRAATRPDDRTKGSTAGIKPGPSEAKSKGGRPSTSGKPWEALGISRQAYYKRQKKGATK